MSNLPGGPHHIHSHRPQGRRKRHPQHMNHPSLHLLPVGRWTLTSLLLPALLLLMAGCTASQEPRPGRMSSSTEWQLSQNAQAMFHFLEYQELSRNEKNTQALTSLQRAIAIDPSPTLYLELANFHWRRKNLDETRLALKAALEKFPENREITVTLVHYYLTQKQVESAVTTYKSYLQLRPDDHDVRAELGSILIENQQYPEAADVLSAIPEAERTPEILFLQAKANAGIGLRQKAIDLLTAALKESPDFVEAMGELAYLYELEKNYVAAEEVYDRLSELRNGSDEVWLRQISLNLKLNNPDKALDLTLQGPRGEDFLLQATSLFLQEKFYDQAEQILSRVEEIPETSAKVAFYQALLAYEGHDDKEAALDRLETIPADHPLYDRALRFRSQILFQLERHEEALDAAKMGQTLFPGETGFWILESSIHESRGDLAQARATIENGLENNPDDPDLLFQLGFLEHLAGNTELALEIMERLITINPDNADALNFVGYTLADAGRELERALVLIEKAHSLEPGSPHILDSLAWVQFRLGAYGKAWENIQQVVSQIDDDPLIWEHYGDIARAMGKESEAYAAYQKALSLDPENAEGLRSKLRKLPQPEPPTRS